MYHDLIKKTINKLAMLDREQALPALKQLGYLCNTSLCNPSLCNPNDISSSATFWFLEEKSVRLSQNSFRREERERREERRERREEKRREREREREREEKREEREEKRRERERERERSGAVSTDDCLHVAQLRRCCDAQDVFFFLDPFEVGERERERERE